MADTKTKPFIAFQGAAGAYSEIACRLFAADFEPLPCTTFESVFEAVVEGKAERAMLPVENSVAGRVSDIHHLLPESDLSIVGEHFLPIRHQCLALPGARLDDIETVHSHVMALGQCRAFIKHNGLHPIASGDTANAARQLKEVGDMTRAVIASELAASLYGLEILQANVEDERHNTTRFLAMSRVPADVCADGDNVVTSFVFTVRNIPAALYKAMGGFATNGVNMTKLESYQLGGSFMATQFYADIEGHPDQEPVRLALEELGFFSSSLKILGVYPAARPRDVDF